MSRSRGADGWHLRHQAPCHAGRCLTSLYSYRCPRCGAKRSGLLKVDAETPRCDTPIDLVPAQDWPSMVKQPAAPSFRMAGVGAYSGCIY